MKNEVNNRNIGLDLLRIIACFGIMILHCIRFTNDHLLPLYYVGTISVPLFFMISGYLINSPKLNYKYIFTKILNFIIFIIIWSLIIALYLHFFLYKQKMYFSDMIIGTLFGTLTQKDLLSVFWFLWATCFLYLISPFLVKISKNNKLKKIFIILLSIISEIIFLLNIKYNFLINIIQILRIWTSIFYFYIGIYIKNISQNIKTPKHNFFLIILFFAIMILFETYIGIKFLEPPAAEFFYDSFIVKINCILIFVSILKIPKFKFANKITYLASLTVGLYPIHKFLIEIISKTIKIQTPFQKIVLLLFIPITSLLICIIIDKIPVIREIIHMNYTKLFKNKSKNT